MMANSAPASSQAMWDPRSVQNRRAVCQNRITMYLRLRSSISSGSAGVSSNASISLSRASVSSLSAARASGALGSEASVVEVSVLEAVVSAALPELRAALAGLEGRLVIGLLQVIEPRRHAPWADRRHYR